MNKIVFLLLCFLSCFSHAQGFSVSLVDQPVILLPGKANSLVFKIDNKSELSLDVVPQITLPENWALVAPVSRITLQAKQAKIYILSVNVPLYALNNTYDMEFNVLDSFRDIVVKNVFSIQVKKVQKLSLKLLSTKPFIKAGDTIFNSFHLINQGNVKEDISLSTTLGTFVKSEQQLCLAPGESTLVYTYTPTDSKATRALESVSKLTATSTLASISPVFVNTRTDVIPSLQVNDDMYLRFPVTMSLAYMGAPQLDGYGTGFQGAIYGKGSLNEHNTKTLEFKAISPGQLPATSFSEFEQYYITYRQKDLYLHMGDKTYSSSNLTNYSRYGRGIEVNKKFDNLEIGSYFLKPRFYKEINREFTVYTQYNFNVNSSLRYGYLFNDTQQEAKDNHLHYLSAKTNIVENVSLAGEYAISNQSQENGYAWQLQAQAYFDSWNINANYIYASRDFKGYYSDTDFFTANGSYSISPKLRIQAIYQKNARNLANDTLYRVAPYTERYELGARYKYSKNGSISFFHGNQKYEDRMEQKQFYYKERFSRFELLQFISQFTVSLQSFFGQTSNYLTQSSGNSSMYSANISYNSKKSSYSVYGSYSILDRYLQRHSKQWLFGATVDTRIFNNINGRLFYQNTYLLEESYGARDLFEFALNYRFLENQNIELVSRYSLAQQEIEDKDLSFFLRYSLTLNAPVKKIKQYGILKGHIRSLNSNSLEGIRVYLGNYTALVDKNGDFTISNIKPNIYYFELDSSTLGMKDITDISVPFKFNVEQGENYLNLGITTSANITGEFIFDDPQKFKEKQSVIVEISNSSQVFRKICDLAQGFDFTYLRPGEYRLKVYSNTLDPEYSVENDQFDFTLEPDQLYNVQIKMISHKKQVKFLQQPMKIGFNSQKTK